MKQLLFSQSTHSGDGAIAVQTYFVDANQLAHNWDGQSPLDVRVDILVATATAYFQSTMRQIPQFVRLELTSQQLKTGDRFYFFTVTFAITNDAVMDDFPDTVEVVMTLDYRAIVPEVRHFNNDDEYQQYMVLQKLINQVGELNPVLEQQVLYLSREQLWKLDIAVWSFTSIIDLHRWLTIHCYPQNQLKSTFCS